MIDPKEVPSRRFKKDKKKKWWEDDEEDEFEYDEDEHEYDVHDQEIVSAVPVPPSVLLLGTGLFAFIMLRRHKLMDK